VTDSEPSRLKPLAGSLVLCLVSVMLCLAGIEALARLVVPRDAARSYTVGMLRRHHPLLGWDLPPGARARIRQAEFDVEMEVNARGLRGPDRGHEKPAGVKRVLLLGDSFTEGYTVVESHTARAVLERLLNQAACGRFEVLNAGVAGYGTDQELLYFRERGHRYAPDQVVLFFFGNDLSDNVSRRKKPFFELVEGRLTLRNTPVPPPGDGKLIRGPVAGPPQPGAWRGSAALELLGRRTAAGNPGLHRLLSRLGLVRPLLPHVATLRWLSVYGPESPQTEQMWHRTTALLAKLREEVEARGAQLVVFYVPGRFEVNDRDWRRTLSRWQLQGPEWQQDRVFTRLQAECGSRGIRVVDPRGAFRRAERSSSPAYLRQDPHWTTAGNTIAARQLADFLVEHVLAGCRLPDSP